MGLLDAVSTVITEAGPDRTDADSVQSKGSYWCDDCGVRIRDVEVEGDGVPSCPECGASMTFERRHASGGCAC